MDTLGKKINFLSWFRRLTPTFMFAIFVHWCDCHLGAWHVLCCTTNKRRDVIMTANVTMLHSLRHAGIAVSLYENTFLPGVRLVETCDSWGKLQSQTRRSLVWNSFNACSTQVLIRVLQGREKQLSAPFQPRWMMGETLLQLNRVKVTKKRSYGVKNLKGFSSLKTWLIIPCRWHSLVSRCCIISPHKLK